MIRLRLAVLVLTAAVALPMLPGCGGGSATSPNTDKMKEEMQRKQKEMMNKMMPQGMPKPGEMPPGGPPKPGEKPKEATDTNKPE